MQVSSSTVQSDVFIATHLQAQHSNASFLTTQSHAFQPFYFAGVPEHGLSITPVDELGSVVKHVYIPAERRRDGPGGVGEQISWKAFSLRWHGRELLAYLAAVSRLQGGGLTISGKKGTSMSNSGIWSPKSRPCSQSRLSPETNATRRFHPTAWQTIFCSRFPNTQLLFPKPY